jgi:hypothetical protein
MVTIPKGVRCKQVGGRYVVDDVARVTGANEHDLQHYYVWLDDADVTEIAG